MKKITFLTLSVIFLALSHVAFGQITITQADLPTAGLKVTMDSDLTSTPVPGPAGTSQTWNYGTLVASKTTTISFMNATGSPYASVFPAANLCDSTYGDTGYNYFNASSSAFDVVGREQFVHSNGYLLQVEINLSPYFEQASLPATYHTILGGKSYGSEVINKTISFFSKIKVTTTITYADTVDAWGTLTTPAGTYPALRQKHYELDVDSVFGYLGSWVYVSSTSTPDWQYKWYTTGAGYFLVAFDMGTTNSTVKHIVWDNSVPATAGINELSVANKIMAYPNPCSSQITLQSNLSTEQVVNVFDITGRQIEKVSMKNGQTNLNTSTFAKGMYLYRVTDMSGNLVDQGKFSVQ